MDRSSSERESERFLVRNTTGISSVEFFWGLGLPLLIESAFLQVFLHTLGASGTVLGIVPTLLFLGQAICGIFSAYITSHISNRRKAVIISHLIPPMFLIAYSLILILTGFNSYSIPVFLLLYSLFSLAIGLVMPVWQNYIIGLFPMNKVLPAFSVMMLVQSSGKLIGSFLLAGVVEKLSITPASSALVFLACGIIFAGSSFLFLLTKDISPDDRKIPHTRPPFFVYLRSTLKEILRNRNFLLFLGADLEFFAVISAISFYAAYGLEYAALTPAFAAGGLIIANITGQILVNTMLGIRNRIRIIQMTWISRVTSITGILCLILLPNIAGLLGAAFLLGVSRSIRSMVFTPAVKKLSGKNDSTGYFALAPVITLPIAGGIPVISGKILDMTRDLGIGSYRLLFGFLGLFVIISLIFLKKIDLD